MRDQAQSRFTLDDFRSQGQIVIYACPEDQRDKLLMILKDDFEFQEDFGIGDEMAPLKIGAVYGLDEAPLDVFETVADAVIQKVPEATFCSWSDPKYEYDGMAVMYAPDLGRYVSRCNSNGETYLTAQEIQAGLDAGDLVKSAGLAWLERMRRRG